MQQSVKNESRGQAAYTLDIPIDASGIHDFKPGQEIKVLVVQHNGEVLGSQLVKINDKGIGTATFRFRERPGSLKAILGPHSATDEELQGLQTLTVDVPARQWSESSAIKLTPIIIAPFYWYWWIRWCRTFVIRGRVICPDGSPVPGANVCAFDVDAWWWWISKQQVGCATTDINGTFEIQFRWCCGWWPGWWWKTRNWEFSSHLAEQILPVLQRDPRVPQLPPLNPRPNTEIFKHLLGEEEFADMSIDTTVRSVMKRTPDITAIATQQQIGPDFLNNIRERLLKRIPALAHLKCLHIWPWWPSQPWLDCSPDIIFTVTQDCMARGTVIVDEQLSDTRWDAPTTMSVTLVANDQACCLAQPADEPSGNCAIITEVCEIPVQYIGGNPNALATPAGYYSPGNADRPFGGRVTIQGALGTDVDYYEFEWSNGGPWQDMPASAVLDINRNVWLGPNIPLTTVSFMHTISGRRVYETRRHYEASSAWAALPPLKHWMAANYWSLMHWDTESTFFNGTYKLRIKGWQEVGGNLVNPQILPICGTDTVDELVLRIDNRIVGPGSVHADYTTPHPCGPGTVHTCTSEPDTNILAIRILHADGTVSTVQACESAIINSTDKLQVDFFAHDPEGHLSSYSLNATYGINQIINLLGLPGHTLVPLLAGPEPAALQVGPSYGAAQQQGAPSPVWHGGAMRYEVLATQAFPIPCCYQLELYAVKRTIVHCTSVHSNYSEYSFHISY